MDRLDRVSIASLITAAAALCAAYGCTRQDPPIGVGATASAVASAAVSTAPSADPAPASSADDDDIADDAGVPDASVDASAEVPEGSDVDVKVGGEFKIAATSTNAWIYAGPNDETTKLGYLRMGAIVDRSEKPIARTKRCKGGWYRVAPKGFICAGKRATLDVNDPVVVASWKPPMRGEPLPYRYGRSKEVAPHLYYRAPSRKEQERAETIRWAEYMPNYPKERFLPYVGQVDEVPPFLLDGKSLPKPYGATTRLRHPSGHEGKSSNHSSFAFQSIHEIEGRMFGLTTDLLLVPLDRVNMVKLTEIHGGPIPDLPAGIVLGSATKFLPDEKGNPKKVGEYQRFDTVGLTGATRGDMWETADGHWISATAMKVIRKRDEKHEEWPSFAKAEPAKKWIDVSVKNQMLIAYEGTRAVYVTSVSTGIGDLGDPEKTLATKRGVFTIKAKHLTATMSSDESVDDYELSDVPYVQYFQEGYALHAAFWHEKFGRPWSHGCVNLTPRDAAWIFEWTDPQLPKEWHGIQGNGEGTIVYVHP
ncbi:MAG: L,D-transpeptidase [Polyangiaceae bacterium]